MAFQSIAVVLSLQILEDSNALSCSIQFCHHIAGNQNCQDFAMKVSLPDEIEVWSSLMS